MNKDPNVPVSRYGTVSGEGVQQENEAFYDTSVYSNLGNDKGEA